MNKKAWWPGTEAEMAAALVKKLEADGHTVYQEVPTPDKNGTIDIVAERDGIRLAFETKKSEGLSVLEQAVHRSKWMPCYCVVPMPSPFFRRVCQALGVGCVNALRSSHYDGTHDDAFTVLVEPCTTAQDKTLQLFAGHRTFAKAGTRGTRWTLWKEWCARIVVYVRANPATRPVEAVKAVNLGKYKASTLVSAIRSKQVPLKLEKRGRLLVVLPA